MKKPRFLYIGALLLFCTTVKTFGQPDEIVLAVQVDGGKAGTGQAILSVFSSPENYLKTPFSTKTLPFDENGQARFRINDLPAGEYAVNVVYDTDMNNKLNTGLFGIPTELVGFSNNARGMFGPPSYEDVSFTFMESQELTIHLGKAND